MIVDLAIQAVRSSGPRLKNHYVLPINFILDRASTQWQPNMATIPGRDKELRMSPNKLEIILESSMQGFELTTLYTLCPGNACERQYHQASRYGGKVSLPYSVGQPLEYSAHGTPRAPTPRASGLILDVDDISIRKLWR